MLSDRIRPNVEAAPWVIAEIKRLEGALMEAQTEAAIAWSVCASIHREYTKGKDPFYTTRQKDFVRHEEEARAKLRALEGE